MTASHGLEVDNVTEDEAGQYVCEVDVGLGGQARWLVLSFSWQSSPRWTYVYLCIYESMLLCTFSIAITSTKIYSISTSIISTGRSVVHEVVVLAAPVITKWDQARTVSAGQDTTIRSQHKPFQLP